MYVRTIASKDLAAQDFLAREYMEHGTTFTFRVNTIRVFGGQGNTVHRDKLTTSPFFPKKFV